MTEGRPYDIAGCAVLLRAHLLTRTPFSSAAAAPGKKMSYERLRALAGARQRRYPPGTRLRLVRFAPSEWVDDNQHVPAGTLGEVTLVDSMGMIHVRWDNGSSLGLTERDGFEAVT
jgi:hypothetical protein